MERRGTTRRHRRGRSAAIALVLAAGLATGLWAATDHGSSRPAGTSAAGTGQPAGPTTPVTTTPPTTTTTTPPTTTGPGPTTTAPGGAFLGPTGMEAGWVVAENRRPGSAAWRITGTPPGLIAGFANRVSARVGQSVNLYVTTNAPTFVVQAYRMGYYGGAGARLVWSSGRVRGRGQPACPVIPHINMVACDNWAPSLSVAVSAAFVQGDYLFKLVGSGGQASYVPLTVWDPASHATYLVENDIYTWQAWNPYGGYDFYAGIGACPRAVYPVCNRARVASFDRPYGYGQGAADFFGNEYPLVRFAEQSGLDVTYATSADFEQDPAFLRQHRAILSLGHDECWSLGERLAAQAAAAHGVNIVFFGASPVLRHVRLQASPLGPDREEVDYRDGAADPLNGRGSPLEVTGNTWQSPPATWSEVPFVGEGYTGYLEPGARPAGFVVSEASAWLFAGTGAHNGLTVPGLLDSDFDQWSPGASPGNVEVMAHSPMPRGSVQTNAGAPASDVTYYAAPSGAGIFDTGTVAWISDLGRSSFVARMTANLLHLFGQGPAGRIRPSVPNASRVYG